LTGGAGSLPHFDVRRMRAGHPYAFIFDEDNTLSPEYFVYEADPVEVRGVPPDMIATGGTHRPASGDGDFEHSIACSVTGALYNDIAEAGADPQLAMQLADVFAWTVDFYRIQKDDIFSVVYREKTVDGVPYGRTGDRGRTLHQCRARRRKPSGSHMPMAWSSSTTRNGNSLNARPS
jgi:hypothetical protein